MSPKQLLEQYSREILSFRMEGEGTPPLPALDQGAVVRMTDQALHFTERGGRSHILLLGAGDGVLAEALAQGAKSQGLADFTLCSLNPDRIRLLTEAGGLRPDGFSGRLLVDTSARAVFFLLSMLGYTPANTTLVMHPGMPPEENKGLRGLQRFFLSARPYSFEPEEGKTKEPGLSVAAIVHPDEPALEEFVAHIPEWVSRLVLVWDGSHIPDCSIRLRAACPVTIRQEARPLGRDFSAQRNYALALCRSEWVFFLDADERLRPQAWEAMRAFLRFNSRVGARQRENALEPTPDWPVCAASLPRLTLYPDAEHFRAGYGLWPDPQLRLFRRTEAVRFVNPVHEVLSGMDGPLAILPHCPIEHASYLLKDRQTLAERLAAFDLAAGKSMHRLNEEFPSLPLSFWEQLLESAKGLDALVMEKAG